jgi:hypothetical protein
MKRATGPVETFSVSVDANAVKHATLVDAIVMASAALRGDVVHTRYIDDLGRLQRHCPDVRLRAV